MTAPWRKVVADVWHERTRGVLVVLAIAIGVTSVLAVLSAYAVLRRELNRGYLATNPASAVFLTDLVDDALLSAVIARADVADADARRIVTGRIRTRAGEWRRLQLFVVRNFNQLDISTMTPEAGAWPPATGELLIERDAFQVAGAGIGDVVTIETAAGGERTVRVAGRVHDAGQAQARMENMVYGYITVETLAALGGTPVLDRLYVLVSGNRFDQARVQQVAADVKAWLERSGHAVRRMDVPPPGQHPHALIMGALLLVMASFGVIVLLLSGVIVVNLMVAMMAGERRQVGVMKAVGASRGQIARIYLAEAGLFGVAALLIATPAGIAGGRALSRYLAVLLNFDLTSMAVPVWVYLLVAAAALVVPIAAAAYPVAAGTDMTVRAAIAVGGISADRFGTARLDHLLSRVGAGGQPLFVGIRNSLRCRARTGLTLGTLSAAGAFFIAALSFRASMIASLDRMFGAGTAGGANRYAYDQHMLMIYVFLIAVSGVLALVGGLGLVTATSLNMRDRRRELGVLRAIGASPATVRGIVVVEAVCVAVVSWAVAVLAAWPITAGLMRLVAAIFRQGVDVVLAPVAIAVWLALVAALSAVASVVPAVVVSRRSVREAVSHE